jgi:hypothetical protein
MTMRDWPEVTPRMRQLIAYLREHEDDADSRRWLDMIKGAMYGKQSPGGLSGWVNRNDSQNVETLQAQFNPANGAMFRVTYPGVRNAVWTPFGIRFFTDPTQQSDRVFHGVLTVASHDDVYVGWDRNIDQMIAYHLVESE